MFEDDDFPNFPTHGGMCWFPGGLLPMLHLSSAMRLSKILDVVHSRGGATWVVGGWLSGRF